MSGCSSGVEHNLAKVGVERSNRFTRSIFSLRQIRQTLDAKTAIVSICSEFIRR